MSEILDSGNRREFSSGAVRDIQEGKGRCDLMPLDVIGNLIDSLTIRYIHKFQLTENVEWLYEALKTFIEEEPQYGQTENPYASAMLDLAVHFEDGAKNTVKGIGKRVCRFHAISIPGCGII